MMKNEIRLGNIFYHIKEEIHYGTYYVCEITKDGVVNENGKLIPYNEIEPIPLTEEWLLRFGFKQLDKYTWLKNGWFVYNRKRGFVTGSKKREIKLSFVHKLQNWYYLTGEELTIKP